MFFLTTNMRTRNGLHSLIWPSQPGIFKQLQILRPLKATPSYQVELFAIWPAKSAGFCPFLPCDLSCSVQLQRLVCVRLQREEGTRDAKQLLAALAREKSSCALAAGNASANLSCWQGNGEDRSAGPGAHGKGSSPQSSSPCSAIRRGHLMNNR